MKLSEVGWGEEIIGVCSCQGKLHGSYSGVLRDFNLEPRLKVLWDSEQMGVVRSAFRKKAWSGGLRR